MSTIENQIAALEAAIATGALEVKYRSGETSREVKYRSIGEMEAILSKLKAQVGPRRVSRTVGVVVAR